MEADGIHIANVVGVMSSISLSYTCRFHVVGFQTLGTLKLSLSWKSHYLLGTIET